MRTRVIGFGAALLLLGGCGDKAATKPTGSVVATVDGHEITTGDLEAEARARGVDFNTRDGEAARAGVLRFVIGRTILVDMAEKQRLDNDPKLLADRRRMDAGMVAQVMTRKLMAEVPKATDQQIAAYRAANPYIFAKRQAITADQTQVMPTAPLPKGGRETSYALMEQLAQLQLPSKRERVVIDSAGLPTQAVESMLARPELPVQVGEGPVVTFLTFVSARPDPAPEAEQRRAAIAALETQGLDRRVNAEIDKMIRDKRVVYQQGYAPR